MMPMAPARKQVKNLCEPVAVRQMKILFSDRKKHRSFFGKRHWPKQAEKVKKRAAQPEYLQGLYPVHFTYAASAGSEVKREKTE